MRQSPTASGQQAETAVAHYLSERGFRIFGRNWRTKFCEIDLIVGKQRIIYFVEVKYRQTINVGSGLDYVTPAKLKRMQRAAQAWVTYQHWSGQYVLAAAEVSGNDFLVTNFVEIFY